MIISIIVGIILMVIGYILLRQANRHGGGWFNIYRVASILLFILAILVFFAVPFLKNYMVSMMQPESGIAAVESGGGSWLDTVSQFAGIFSVVFTIWAHFNPYRSRS